MDPELIKEYGPWVFLIYIIIKDLVPKIAPDFAAAISKKISTEERLFKLLENNATIIATLNVSFAQLSETLKHIDERLTAIEDNMDSNTSAIKVASRLIKD